MKYERLIEIFNQQELTMIKIKFNNEEIDYKILFENTLQIANSYALGDNGAILEVAGKDIERAKHILLFSFGIELEYDSKRDRFEFVNKIEKITDKIPLLKKCNVGYRIAIIGSIFFISFTGLTLLNSITISISELTGNYFCVDKIIHSGKEIEPNTSTENIVIQDDNCKESVLFYNRGMIYLLGYNTNLIIGKWSLKTEKILIISDVNQYEDIYEGEYMIETNLKGTMELVSPKTTIIISKKWRTKS